MFDNRADPRRINHRPGWVGSEGVADTDSGFCRLCQSNPNHLPPPTDLTASPSPHQHIVNFSVSEARVSSGYSLPEGSGLLGTIEPGRGE